MIELLIAIIASKSYSYYSLMVAINSCSREGGREVGREGGWEEKRGRNGGSEGERNVTGVERGRPSSTCLSRHGARGWRRAFARRRQGQIPHGPKASHPDPKKLFNPSLMSSKGQPLARRASGVLNKL